MIWRFSNAELDPRARELRVDGKLVALEPKPFEVLLLLLEHAGELLTVDDMLEAAWTGRIVNEATITNTIFKIRKALGDDDQAVIRTVPKAGYRLVAEVERIANESARPSSPELQAGSEIPGRDQWQLAERLGAGGYGEAWLARNRKTGEERVFKFCLESDRLSAFKREVTLYRLLHTSLPEFDGIARILEWNFDQPPYYIESEYAGENLRRWAELRGGLGAIEPDERARIVARVASAVAAAHSVGVLHKDLKPENILVSGQGDSMTVRLCDFGVGRLLESDRLGALGITRIGFTQTVAANPSTSGTLFYMAPELMSSGMPSVQSDIYALGVLLYQIAIGDFSQPMPHGWEAFVGDELLRQDITDCTNGDRSKRIGSAQLLADRLSDLPRRRDELALQRAAALRAGKAQLALERARVRRPWLIAAAVILIAGLVSSLFMAGRAHNQALLAQAFNTFIAEDILNGDDAASGARPEITMKSAIIKALPLVSRRFADDPEAEASLDTTLARTLRRLSDSQDALKLDQQSEDLDRKLFGSNDVRTLVSQVNVALDLQKLQREDESRKILEAALPDLKSSLAATDPRLFPARKLEAMYACKDSFACAESHALYAGLVTDIQASRGNERMLRSVQLDYAGDLIEGGKAAEADRVLKQWLPEVRSRYGENSFQTLEFRGMLGDALLAEHRFPEAAVELRARFEGQQKIENPDAATTISNMLELSNAETGEDQWPAALDLRMKAFQLAQKLHGDEYAQREVGADVAAALDMMNRPAEALDWAQKSWAAARKSLSPDDGRYLQSQFLLARCLAHAGHTPEARKMLDEIAPIVNQQYAADVDIQSQLLQLQAEVARGERDFASARGYLTREIRLEEQAWGAGDPIIDSARKLLQSLPAG